MGNKEEITNLIGRKGSKMTVKSNVKTLALKVYDEQIPGGWEKLKERIKEKKIQKRFLHTPEQTLEDQAKNWKWTPGK